MNHIRHIAVTLLLLSPFGLFAQQSIDSAMKALENAKSVTNEVYSERRNPSTKEIESASYLFEFTDNKLADKIIEAMRKERSKACAYEMSNRHSNSMVYSISFQDSKGSFSKYTLLQRGSSKWMLSVKKGTAKSSSKSSKSKSSKARTDIIGIDDDLLEIYGINPSISDYAHTDGNTTIYTGPDGNTIVINNGCLNDIQELYDSEYILEKLEGLEKLETLESLKSLQSLSDLDSLKNLEKLKKQKKQRKSKSGSKTSKTNTRIYTSSNGHTTTTTTTYEL
ncbi:hypothetical protein [uncultured Duncaniella sp.]|uniref:hypothetical protein n=1 Tax=uncultured Duncaniella sp. TaxID=2768039 RepID=UPI0025D2F018|nr:hypothetical protein [uncultured Duncaniella sp.]